MPLNAGWSFISLNLEASDMNLNTVFAGTTSLGSGDFIKNQAVFADYYAGFGFFGGLNTLTTNEMYAVKVAVDTTLTVVGTPVVLPKTVTLNTGWTYLPYPRQCAKGILDAMPSFTYVAGDQVKSQLSFAEYYAGFGFFGSLAMMEPGLGYKTKVATGGDATFNPHSCD